MKTDRKPPLAKSPMRIRTRQALRPANVNSIQIPIGSTAKTQIKGSEMKQEYHTISGQLSALAKMVQDELGALSANAAGFGNNPLNGNNNNSNEMGSSQFERGRFYDAYSARRNERLRKKKQSETGEADEPKTAYNLGVKVESTKKKKSDNLKKNYSSVDRSQHHRYSLRSTTKKPPLPSVPMNVDETTVGKTVASRTRRK